jgi:uncharacterized membrane protein
MMAMAGRYLLAVLFVAAGALHLLFPEPYTKIIPPFLPMPGLLVFISGIAEIAGGAGLLVPKLQRPAAYGLVLLLLAVFPANIYMAVAHVQFPGFLGTSWAQWLRLPLQIPIIWWALQFAKKR